MSLRLLSAALASVLFVACSSQGQQGQQTLPATQVPQTTQVQRSYAQVKQQATAHQTSQQATANVFAEAQGLQISDSDFDAYIDPSVTGADRQLARHLLSLMPENQRSDFVYLGKDGRLLSNNPEMLKYVQIKHEQANAANAVRAESAAAVSAMDYSDSCSPPNPPGSPGGAYSRNVSKCGFATGWGFVNVQCGTSQFASGDAGHLYFELQGNGIGTAYGKSLTEGGVEYYSDSSVAPYLRSSYYGYLQNSNGYVNMNNNSTRYACGQNLVITHGATADANYTYTEVGVLPSQYNPSTTWMNYGTFTLNQASYLFLAAPGDISGSGTDGAGTHTPCTGCSISEVTAIAQNNLPPGAGYQFNGSYFGAGNYGGNVHWMQVAFGEWLSNCTPGTTVCSFHSSPNISVYAGGPQFYPSSNVSGTYANPLGYGPYETYDQIDLTYGGIPAGRQQAGGPFTVPTPPPAPTPTPYNGPTPTPRPKPTPNPCIRDPHLCMAPIRTPSPAPTPTKKP